MAEKKERKKKDIINNWGRRVKKEICKRARCVYEAMINTMMETMVGAVRKNLCVFLSQRAFCVIQFYGGMKVMIEIFKLS